MTCVVPSESTPTEEGLFQDPEEEMTQKDNGSARKKGKVASRFGASSALVSFRRGNRPGRC